MSAEINRNQIDSEGRGRSTHRGDVPDSIRRRYYVDDRGGPGLGFYADARIRTATFRDLGARLVAPCCDPNAIRDMAAVASHRGWSLVVVHGDPDFRREAWLAAMTLGVEVRGYRATERDREELDRRTAAAARKSRRETPAQEESEAPRSRSQTLSVVEAVVRSRVADQPAQERILAAARNRITKWLETGARFESIVHKKADLEVGRTPERQHGR